MQFEMKMPDLATNDSDIRIVRWLIEPGQRVERGRALVEVETDKATTEVESAVSGVLGEVRCHADDTVSVGQVIAVFEVEATAPRTPSRPDRAAAAESPAPVPSTATALPPRDSSDPAPRGMFARNRASASQAAPIAASGDVISLTPAQRTAAKRLQSSKQTVPHFYLQTSAGISGIAARLRENPESGLAWDAFFVLAAARALCSFHRFRRRLEGEQLVPAPCDAIGVAVDHDEELYVVAIDAPGSKTVEQISAEIRRQAEQVRRGDGEARRIRPALMTVTNLGVCNVESFIPIINPPEIAVLGIGRAQRVPVVRDGDRIAIEVRCQLALSADHRAVSGRYAGEFLGAIVRELESISREKDPQ